MPHRPLLHRALARLGIAHAAAATRRFFRAVERADRTQMALLRRLLRAHAASSFGHDHGLADIRDYETFRRRIPIQRYEDIAPYIERVRRGEVSALFAPNTPILMFALTSGTTAEPKYIPVTQQVLAETRRGWNIWGLKALLDHPHCILRHITQVTSPMEDHRAPSGVPCGAITGLLAATQKRVVRKYYTTPLLVSKIADSQAKYYTIMRLAIPKDVAWLVTANPGTLLLLARIAADNAETLIRDIRDGTLSSDMPIDPDIRAALARQLRPDPEGARRLQGILDKHGALLPRHYWRPGFLAHWTGGTMGLYRSEFPSVFGHVPARDIGLIASEGRMTIPLADDTATGVLAVTGQFFEFIPEAEYDSSQPTVLRSADLETGSNYFLLLTNASGLFRYDIGDRVRVTDWMGEAPMVEFLSRDAHTSSLAGEKLTEDQVILAMGAACAPHPPVELFVLAPRWGSPPRYRLYIETPVARSHRDLAVRLDDALGRANLEYASKRNTLRLGPVELCTVDHGALARHDRELRRHRASTSEQFKHQYLIARPDADGDLAALRAADTMHPA